MAHRTEIEQASSAMQEVQPPPENWIAWKEIDKRLYSYYITASTVVVGAHIEFKRFVSKR
jgi:hypothetical protein